MNIKNATLWEQCKGLLFRSFPHHLVSRITYWFTRQSWSASPLVLSLFTRAFNINLTEAEISDLSEFKSFNDFFTRKLKADARPINPNPRAIICPCDGTISETGIVANEQLIQAKGRYFTLQELLAEQADLYEKFRYGSFCTIYLSPRDYHRVHMPMDGSLHSMVYVPGRLFSVAPYAPKVIPQLYARNERVISVFKVKGGWMCSIMVGAVNVAAIEMVWHGMVTPPHRRRMQRFNYAGTNQSIDLKKGAQMGTFNMGSTVILLFSSNLQQWVPALSNGTSVKLGAPVAYLRTP